MRSFGAEVLGTKFTNADEIPKSPRLVSRATVARMPENRPKLSGDRLRATMMVNSIPPTAMPKLPARLAALSREVAEKIRVENLDKYFFISGCYV